MLLAVLAVGFVLWATQSLILPVLLAMFFALVGNPIIRVLQRLRVPRFVSALAVLFSGIAITVLLVPSAVLLALPWLVLTVAGRRFTYLQLGLALPEFLALLCAASLASVVVGARRLVAWGHEDRPGP